MNRAPTKMLLRSIRVERSHIGYIKWLLESHDGMATPTTRKGIPDVVDFLVAPDFEAEFDLFLVGLAEELDVEVVDLPDEPPLGG